VVIPAVAVAHLIAELLDKAAQELAQVVAELVEHPEQQQITKAEPANTPAEQSHQTVAAAAAELLQLVQTQQQLQAQLEVQAAAAAVVDLTQAMVVPAVPARF
jgi:hypothetical protein